MPIFRFTKKAHKSLFNLDPFVRKKIEEKIIFLSKQKELPAHIHVLCDMEPATHRLQIGSYRLLLEYIGPGQYVVLDLDHRKNVYRK